MREEIINILRFLVAKAMARKRDLVEAVSLYIDYREPLKRLSIKYGYSVKAIAAAVNRIVIVRAYGDRSLAKAVVKLAAPIVISRVSARVDSGWPPRCLICGRLINSFPEDHLLKSHNTEIERELARVIAIIREAREQKLVPWGMRYRKTVTHGSLIPRYQHLGTDSFQSLVTHTPC